jgi:plastocyanin
MKTIRTLATASAVLSVIALTACGGTANNASGQRVALDVKVTGNTMQPNKLTAHQGDTVVFTVTTDKEEEIHLHGYDYMFQMKPGQKQSKTFTADKTGNFEIEIETTSTHLGELDVLPR